jgi:MFS superfamily sulfate permease-like transporter
LTSLPADGLRGLKQNWAGELLAGFLIFLIALPLCLGIALASGVPPLSGIIAACVGGLVVSQLSGSYVTINGPAAGLIVVILGAVDSLGGADRMLGYRLTLAAIVVAGLLQIAFGLLKAGKLSSFFPTTAVHGLLASIGIIIMVKQSYVMFGLKAQGHSALEQLWHFPAALPAMNPEIALIGLSTLAVVVLLPLIKPLRRVPAPLVGVLLGMNLGHYFDLDHEHTYVDFLNHQYHVGPDFLVTLPSRIRDGLVTPDWSGLGNPLFWKAVAAIAIIASLETLLSAAAVDKLDPYHRKANLNRDLAAIGVGTAVSGMIGGLPMIAEIVRSSANVNNGAKTRWSNFFHGAFMLVFVVFAPGLIHRIPLASLAAILTYTGFRLASPSEFRKTYEVGKEQFVIFMATILFTLATDLLIGIAMGVLVNLTLHWWVRRIPVSELQKCHLRVQTLSDRIEVDVDRALAFTNLVHFQSQLDRLPGGHTVVINLRGTRLVDHSAMEYLEHFATEYRRDGGDVQLTGLEQHRAYSGHPLGDHLRQAG